MILWHINDTCRSHISPKKARTPWSNKSISILLITWRQQEPGHQQQQHWPSLPSWYSVGIQAELNLTSKYHFWWWPGDASRQDISSHDIDLVYPMILSHHTSRVKQLPTSHSTPIVNGWYPALPARPVQTETLEKNHQQLARVSLPSQQLTYVISIFAK